LKNPANGRIKAVLLDAGGVFLLPDAVRVRAALDGLSIAADGSSIFAAHYHAVGALDRTPVAWRKWPETADPLPGGAVPAAGAPASGQDIYWSAFVRALHIPPERMQAAISELASIPWTSVVTDSVSGLRALAAAGVSLAIVSNAGGTVERDLLQWKVCQVGDGPGACVAAVVDSSVVGFEKPDPRIFQLALERIGADAAAAVHVGDSIHFDVNGARAAGIRPFHFDPADICDDGSHEHLGSLHNLIPLLG